MHLFDFYRQVRERAKNTGERYGQAMFNELYNVRPELAEQVKGTDMDPFNLEDPVSSSNAIWRRFTQFIDANWYLKEEDDGEG